MTPRGRTILAAWAPAAAWGGVIFTLSSFPLRIDPGLLPAGDKTAHLLEYAVLGYLLARALRISRPRTGAGAVVAGAAALGFLYGCTDEFHQAFVPERTPSPGDLLADAAGCLLGAGLHALTRGGRAPTSAAPGAPAPRP